MIRLTAMGCLLLTFLPAVPALAMPACPRPGGVSDPTLDFQTLDPRLVLHHDVDLLGLPRVEGHMETVPRGWTLQGLTIANDQLEIRATWREQHFSDGRVCLWLDKVTARLGMPEQRVYIAADYAEGSCEYQAIMAHERRHVEINRQTVQAHASAVRRAIVDGIRESNPLPLSSPPDTQLVVRRLQAYARPEAQQMISELRQRNGAIDTPDAYRREQAQSACHHWKGGH